MEASLIIMYVPLIKSIFHFKYYSYMSCLDMGKEQKVSQHLFFCLRQENVWASLASPEAYLEMILQLNKMYLQWGVMWFQLIRNEQLHQTLTGITCSLFAHFSCVIILSMGASFAWELTWTPTWFAFCLAIILPNVVTCILKHLNPVIPIVFFYSFSHLICVI